MTLDQLLTLDAIVASGTFRAAAERLNKAQSAVSHQIKKLEEEVGFLLLSRDSYRPQLTSEGEVFFREATRVLEHVNWLKEVAAGLRSDQEPIISIAISATMSLDPILDVLKEVGRRFPSTQIKVASEMMGGPLERLISGEADLIIASLADVPIGEVETLAVGTITIRPVASPDFPAAERSGVRSRREMQAYTQVVVSGTGGRNFDQSRDLLSGGQRWTVSDFQAKKSIIKAGLGWGGIPEHLMEDDLATGALVPLNVEGFPPRHTEIFAIRRRDRPIGQVMAAIWAGLGADIPEKA
ncbi:LysR family transcriptional regulator [Roseobacter denitrificans]|uniref:Transcriptional regulator, LysR family, putative n=1 Tax=Roseobacter denitrificans (strain ATCC 33942 / OCh 114) TaxID=375451 RepID=Q16B53_ROSDO|nr:LysR family transcriptional regulator [Roseobacter denitrificans]ABG30790.1 transcriptional regulator, LysR family, putative [Roseobacter denitrificans OCh 114]AVL53897.1 LysR family transcriptional regulator [Roseobacter denitrificans]SFG46659.1 DNA-binding transcriptional regulator, LysR family [Roseobacter denitrificans OCh 114]